MIDKAHYSLLSHNTFGINVSCEQFVEIGTEEEAMHLLPTLAQQKLLIIGSGSNLLLTKDFPGVVVRSNVKGMTTTEEGESVLLRCGSGEKWDDVVAYSIAHDLHGVENLSLIPGDVGASAVQNIGAYGVELQDVIHSVEAVEISSGQRVILSKEECEYSYRNSRFKREWKNRFFITYVTYHLSHVFTPQLHYGNISKSLLSRGISHPSAKQLREIIIDIRREKLPDPEVLGNAGSFFMNPIVPRAIAKNLQKAYPEMPVYDIDKEQVKLSAGWLIEQCGWKGRALGKAGVYEKQALVLVNKGGATGCDILQLCKRIQQDVFERFKVELKPEVNIL